ncbi:hypothetical protein UlMin_040192 [Ulmus minor]
MGRIVVGNLLIPLYIFYTLITNFEIDNKILKVGEELWKETLPLQMGSRLYQLQGFKPHTRYEVKISYSASIPASFSLQLSRGNLISALRVNRRLLNTEKLIYKTENIDISNQSPVTITHASCCFDRRCAHCKREFILFFLDLIYIDFLICFLCVYIIYRSAVYFLFLCVIDSYISQDVLRMLKSCLKCDEAFQFAEYVSTFAYLRTS